MSTTSIPATPSSGPPPPIRPPVLASDMLREDVAPRRPAHRLLRATLGAVAIVFGSSAVLRELGISHGGARGAMATAAIALLLAVLPAPYAARAAMAVTVGLLPLVLGAQGQGLLGGLGEGGWHGLAVVALLAFLPGTLFFRARYRALRQARVLLAVAFLLSVPALAVLGLGVIEGSAPVAMRVVDALVAGVTLAGAFGFMGAETTGAAGVWAAAIIAGLAGRLGLTTWHPAGLLDLDAVLAVLGVASAGMAVAVGAMQLLAVWLAEAARKVDVHKPVGPSEDEA